MRRDQIIFHVIGVTGGITHPRQAVDLCQRPDQPRQPPIAASTSTVPNAMIGIHILPQQGDVPHTLCHQTARFLQYPRHRAAHFHPARIGHHAKRAKLVAAFLHRQKRRRPTSRLALRQMIKLVLRRKIRVHNRAVRPQHLRQPVVALRPHHQINNRRHPPQNLGPLGLRHTPRDADLQPGLGLLQCPEPPQIGIQLLRCLFPDMAGVDQHHIGIIHRVRRHIALPAQRLRHAFTVIDIHLTAIGFDEQLLRVGHGCTPV